MKKIYIFLSLLTLSFAESQTLNIPDPVFKSILLSSSSDPTSYYYNVAKDLAGNPLAIDANDDGEIQETEAAQVSFLYITPSINPYVHSFVGIQGFVNLRETSFNQHPITSLDLSGMVNLQKLTLRSMDELTQVNLTGMTGLTDLKVQDVTNAVVNFAGVSNLERLEWTDNQSAPLDLSNFENLTKLDASYNTFTTLNLSGLSSIQTIDCSHGSLTALDLSPVAATLDSLSCSHNNIGSLNIQPLTNMTYFYAPNNNSIVSLDAHGLTNLKYLACGGSNFSDINLQGLSQLETLSVGFSALTAIDLTPVPNLKNLYLVRDQLTALDLSPVPNLLFLHVAENDIAALDLSVAPNIETVHCMHNLITNINLSQCSQLKYLDCAYNSLTSLDVSASPLLEHLSCSYNPIAALDVTQNSDLTYFACGATNVSTLDVSNNTQLTQLHAKNSPNLETVFAKNGKNETVNVFEGSPNLRYVCVDEGQLVNVQQIINNFGIGAVCHANSYCSFDPGGAFYEIAGNNRLDMGGDGCDLGDIAFPNLKLTFSSTANSGSLIADRSGSYSYSVQAGEYVVTPSVENPTYFAVSPTNVSVSFPDMASPVAQDFCLVPIGSHSDVEITLMPTSPATPGFEADYKITLTNKGNTMTSGTIALGFDDALLDFVDAAPLPLTQTQDLLTWSFNDLVPFEKREIMVTLDINTPLETPPVTVGDLLSYTATATIANDEVLANNTASLVQTVVNSYDPNDKICLEGAYILPENAGNYVHYQIRFENTGTAAAQNIVVNDMIDTAKFDIGSLVPLDGSHDYYTRINGNKVEFIFENINLPFDDANNDGYVLFKIKTISTLGLGDTFSNTASIYFDYNHPVVTDPAVTTIALLQTKDFEFEDYLTLFPNPADDQLQVKGKGGIVVASIEIYDMLGQLVLAVPDAKHVKTIDVSDLKTGNYLVRVNTDRGISNSKLIKK